jgi:hypothetical protein
MYPSAFKEEYAFQQSEIIVVPGRTIIIINYNNNYKINNGNSKTEICKNIFNKYVKKQFSTWQNISLNNGNKRCS